EVMDVTQGFYSQQLIDMNGDGLPDLVTHASGSQYSVKFNTGRGFSPVGTTWTGVDTAGGSGQGWDALQAWDGSGTRVMFIDMNGDGLVDRVKRNYTGNDPLL